MSLYEDLWLSGRLTTEGQRRFWDRQSADYGSADMTNDNEGELLLTRDLCDDYVRRSFELVDVVTLGGADGCRDPRIVCDTFALHGKRPQRIYFNDLSEKMVRQALGGHLLKYSPKVNVVPLAGDIGTIAESIPRRPRRVIIGVYHLSAFTKAAPAHGFPRDGLTEYLENKKHFGSEFVLQWCKIVSGACTPSGVRIGFNAETVIGDMKMLRSMLETIACVRAQKEAGALRVLSFNGYEGEFFVSHWYNRAGFLEMLRHAFGPRANHARIRRCAKGMVACIDPLERRPEGVLTILNNVVGNMLPEQVVGNLAAIHAMSL